MRKRGQRIHRGTPTINPDLPRCAVCGRQDETVRYVSYPFVYGVVVMWYRSSFSGWWCRKHRIWRLLLAALITTAFGWLGLPFGLIFAPLALIQLSRGGKEPVQSNARTLSELAEHKLTVGDAAGAIRCLEASLRLHDDSAVASRLSELDLYRLPAHQRHSRQVLSVIAALAGAGLLGTAVGALDFLAGQAFSLLFDGNTNLLLAVLSWTPLLAAAFLTGLILFRLVDWAVMQAGTPSLPLGIGVAVASAALALYGVPTGRAIATYFHFRLMGMAAEPIVDTLRTAGAVLTRGGVWTIIDTVVTGHTSTYIHILLLLACVEYGSTSIAAAVSAVRREQRIAAVRSAGRKEATRANAPGWLALLSVGLVWAALVGLCPQQGTVDYLEAIAHYGTAIELWEEGPTDGTMQELQQAIRLKPGFAIAHTSLGWLHYQLGDLEQAEKEFREAIRLQPDEASAYAGLGWIHYSRGDSDRAAQAWEEAIHLEPTSADAHHGLGWIHFWLRDWPQATQAFEEAARLQPDAAHHREGLGFCFLQQGDLDAAVVAFAAALKLNPESAVARGGLGAVHYARGDLDRARRQLELAINLDAEDPLSRLYLGLTHESTGQFEEAIEHLRTALELQPEWGLPHSTLAWVYYQLDQLDDMESEIEQAMALQGTDSSAYSWLATVYIELRYFDRAEAQLMKAIELRPEAWMYARLAETYSAQAKFDLALKMCDKATELDPDDVQALLARADVYIEQQDLDQALVHLQRALTLAPEDSNVHGELSFVHYHKGQFADALSEAQEAVRLQPYSAYGHQRLAFAYHALGETEQGMAAARRAIQLLPKRDTPHYVLGLCHLDRGEKKEAAEAFSTFLDLYWDRPYKRAYKAQAEAYLAELK